MILLGIGAGMAFNPVLLAAMSDVRPEQSGLASGIVNTAFMMGGALGLAVLASLADWRTGDLRDSGSSELAALTGGYQLAFVVSTVFAVGAAAIAGLLLRPGVAPQHAAAHGEVATELDCSRVRLQPDLCFPGAPRKAGDRLTPVPSSRRLRRSRRGRASPGARGRSPQGDVPHETSSHQRWVRAVRRDGFSARTLKRRLPPFLLP